MKKIFTTLVLCTVLVGLAACCSCETEPMVEKNHKLIVPPNFGTQPK